MEDLFGGSTSIGEEDFFSSLSNIEPEKTAGSISKIEPVVFQNGTSDQQSIVKSVQQDEDFFNSLGQANSDFISFSTQPAEEQESFFAQIPVPSSNGVSTQSTLTDLLETGTPMKRTVVATPLPKEPAPWDISTNNFPASSAALSSTVGSPFAASSAPASSPYGPTGFQGFSRPAVSTQPVKPVKPASPALFVPNPLAPAQPTTAANVGPWAHAPPIAGTSEHLPVYNGLPAAPLNPPKSAPGVFMPSVDFRASSSSTLSHSPASGSMAVPPQQPQFYTPPNPPMVGGFNTFGASSSSNAAAFQIAQQHQQFQQQQNFQQLQHQNMQQQSVSASNLSTPPPMMVPPTSFGPSALASKNSPMLASTPPFSAPEHYPPNPTYPTLNAGGDQPAFAVGPTVISSPFSSLPPTVISPPNSGNLVSSALYSSSTSTASQGSLSVLPPSAKTYGTSSNYPPTTQQQTEKFGVPNSFESEINYSELHGVSKGKSFEEDQNLRVITTPERDIAEPFVEEKSRDVIGEQCEPYSEERLDEEYLSPGNAAPSLSEEKLAGENLNLVWGENDLVENGDVQTLDVLELDVAADVGKRMAGKGFDELFADDTSSEVIALDDTMESVTDLSAPATAVTAHTSVESYVPGAEAAYQPNFSDSIDVYDSVSMTPSSTIPAISHQRTSEPPSNNPWDETSTKTTTPRLGHHQRSSSMGQQPWTAIATESTPAPLKPVEETAFLQRVMSVPRRMDETAHMSDPVEQLLTRPRPVMAWGFGGRLVYILPRTTARLDSLRSHELAHSVSTSVQHSVVARVDSVQHLLMHGPEFAAMQSYPGPLPMDATIGGQGTAVSGSVGPSSSLKAPKEAVLRYLKNIQTADHEVPERDIEGSLMLWRLLQHLVEAGTLNGDEKSQSELIRIVSGEPVSRGSVEKIGTAFDVPVVTVDELQRLVLAGKRSAAATEAARAHMWAHALILASHKRDLFQDVARQFTVSCLDETAPIRTLYLLAAGQPSELFEALRENRHNSTPEHGPLGVLDRWREHLASMLANHAMVTDRKVIGELGDSLWGRRGRVAAAHVCYLLADHPIGPLEHPNTRLVLIGGDHKTAMKRYFFNAMTFQRTEIYEYARNKLSLPGHSPSSPSSPFLSQYRLAYAFLLADHGFLDLAWKYFREVEHTLKTSKARVLSPILADEMRAFGHRLSQRLGKKSSESSSWFSNVVNFGWHALLGSSDPSSTSQAASVASTLNVSTAPATVLTSSHPSVLTGSTNSTVVQSPSWHQPSSTVQSQSQPLQSVSMPIQQAPYVQQSAGGMLSPLQQQHQNAVHQQRQMLEPPQQYQQQMNMTMPSMMHQSQPQGMGFTSSSVGLSAAADPWSMSSSAQQFVNVPLEQVSGPVAASSSPWSSSNNFYSDSNRPSGSTEKSAFVDKETEMGAESELEKEKEKQQKEKEKGKDTKSDERGENDSKKSGGVFGWFSKSLLGNRKKKEMNLTEDNEFVYSEEYKVWHSKNEDPAALARAAAAPPPPSFAAGVVESSSPIPTSSGVSADIQGSLSNPSTSTTATSATLSSSSSLPVGLSSGPMGMSRSRTKYVDTFNLSSGTGSGSDQVAAPPSSMQNPQMMMMMMMRSGSSGGGANWTPQGGGSGAPPRAPAMFVPPPMIPQLTQQQGELVENKELIAASDGPNNSLNK